MELSMGDDSDYPDRTPDVRTSEIGGEALWTTWYPNPGEPTTQQEQATPILPEEQITLAAEQEVVPEDRARKRKWIGALSDRPGKIVISGDTMVDICLDTLQSQHPETIPIYIPCFLREKKTALIAIAVHHRMLIESSTLGKRDEVSKIKERIEHLESTYAQIMGFIETMRSFVRPQDIIVVIDRRNYNKTLSQKRIILELDDLVDRISKHRVSVPRNMLEVLVVDYRKPGDEKLRNKKNFTFVDVSEFSVSGEGDPIDKVIYQVTLEAVQRHKLERGIVCIVSGDHHFIPLIKELKSMGLETMLVAQTNCNIHEYVMAEPTYYMDVLSPSAA